MGKYYGEEQLEPSANRFRIEFKNDYSKQRVEQDAGYFKIYYDGYTLIGSYCKKQDTTFHEIVRVNCMNTNATNEAMRVFFNVLRDFYNRGYRIIMK